jgi:K+-sensing histidine kinase KdpD
MSATCLHLARLNEGEIETSKRMAPGFQEIMGASIQYLGSALFNRKIDIQLSQDLPLIQIDAVY